MDTHNGDFDVFGIRIENVDSQRLDSRFSLAERWRRLSPLVRTFVVDALADAFVVNAFVVDAFVVDEDNPGPRWVEPLHGRCGASGNPRRSHHRCR